MEARTLEQIETEIAETKAELKDVHGSETEVYARIVGYYRAVKFFNSKIKLFCSGKDFFLFQFKCLELFFKCLFFFCLTLRTFKLLAGKIAVNLTD